MWECEKRLRPLSCHAQTGQELEDYHEPQNEGSSDQHRFYRTSLTSRRLPPLAVALADLIPITHDDWREPCSCIACEISEGQSRQQGQYQPRGNRFLE